jgi:hypothetical protein
MNRISSRLSPAVLHSDRIITKQELYENEVGIKVPHQVQQAAGQRKDKESL